MFRRILLIGCLLLPVFSFAQQQTLSNWQLYDTFTAKFLDPAKWEVIPTCSATQYLDTTASINLLDCARMVESEELRLKVKAYGHSDIDLDRQFGPSELYFSNPNAIHGISLNFRIAHVEAIACPTNPTDSLGQVLVAGTFFNTGTGDPRDDVNVLFLVQHFATDPANVAHAGAAVFSQNAGYGWLDLGAHPVGVVMNIRMMWDQSDHKFVFRLSDPTGVQAGELTYSIPDSMLPVVPLKLLAARAFVANCTSRRTSADIDVKFKNIFVKP